MVSTKVLSSTTVFNIDNKKKCLPNQHIIMQKQTKITTLLQLFISFSLCLESGY